MSNIMIEWFENNCMQINPDKCNAIIFGNNHNRLELNFNGKTVESMNEVKLLGVTVDKNLKFDKHVSQL